VYFFENFPRQLKAKDDRFHKEFNKLVGIDDVDAREVGGQRVMDKSHGWQALGRHLRTQAGDRSVRLQDTQGRRQSCQTSGGTIDEALACEERKCFFSSGEGVSYPCIFFSRI
jgi:hypothetical protein